MPMKNYFILIILLATIGCKKDPYAGINFEAPVFKDSTIVKTTILNDTIYSNYIGNISSYKDYIIMFANINDYFYHFLDKETGRIIKSFGRLGRSAHEILPVYKSHVNEEQGILTAYQMNTKEIYIFQLDSILQNENYPVKRLSLSPYKGMTFNTAYKCKDGFLLCGGKCTVYPEGARFTHFSERGKIIGSYDHYPISSDSAKDSINKDLNWSQLKICETISPDGCKLAEGTLTGGIIEVLQITPEIKRLALKGYYKPDFHSKGLEIIVSENTPWGFYALTSSNKYLYALSCNGSTKQTLTTEVQVFDWSGNPIKKYMTDRQLTKICVDEKNKKAYAITLLPSREDALVVFDL